MHLTTATLCDFAQVREGLLFVASGGVTRMWRDELPAGMGVMLAVVIELDAIEAERPHEVQVTVMGEDGERVAEVSGGFQIGAEGAMPWEKLNVPLVLDLRIVGLAAYGRYDVGVYLDGNHHQTLTFLVAARPDAGT